MGGQGLSADSQGLLYAVTGNGDFDGITQFGESFIKIRYTPPIGVHPASLAIVDHWTPYLDLVRSGQERLSETKLAGESAPTEAVRPVNSGMSIDSVAHRS